MKRRDFLKTAAFSSAALALEGKMMHAKELHGTNDPPSPKAASLPRRPYGKTGVELSVIGFGGIVVMNAEQEHANRVVAEAVERGVNYFDVAPSYGNAEEKLGPALEPYRKKCFLACKTTERGREGAEKEFRQSLQRLRTDFFDLYQLHALTEIEKDVEAAFAPGGVMEFALEARKAGQIRYLGFSAHSEEAALAALERYAFDSVLFPINFTCYFKGHFGHRVIAKAQEQGAALLALKALARQRWPENDPQRQKYSKCWYQPVTDVEEARLALKFTLSQPVTAAVSPGEESLFRLAVELAPGLEPITPDEQQKLARLAEDLRPIFHTDQG